MTRRARRVRLSLQNPSFYYSFAYCLCIVVFGIRRMRRRHTPYVRLQTTVLALIPIVLATGEPGNEIQAPLAAVILGGLTSSTLLNLVVIPALFPRFSGRASQ